MYAKVGDRIVIRGRRSPGWSTAHASPAHRMMVSMWVPDISRGVSGIIPSDQGCCGDSAATPPSTRLVRRAATRI